MFRGIHWLTALVFAATMTAAQAHDASQSSINIWLRPDQIEVELILSRVPSRSLVDNAPPVPVTDANFESTYHALLQLSAPMLLEIALDGRKIAPSSITIELYQETDLRFDYLFPRPPNGKLSFTASFIKRMGDGYINTLDVNEGAHMIGMDNQTADNLVWETNLGTDSKSAATTTQPTATAGNPETDDHVLADRLEYRAEGHNFFFKAGLLCAIIALVSLGIFIWRKGGGSPPSSP